jgi:hypothetical protein
VVRRLSAAVSGLVKAARVRIGRVKLKDGADLRVLQFPPTCEVAKVAMRWARALVKYDEMPSCFVAIAFWATTDEPWRPHYTIGWTTRDPDMPMQRLMRNAASQIEHYGAAIQAEAAVMHELGYVPVDDPDDAA